MRLTFAVLAAAAAAAFAAAILGEYDLRGITPLISAVMLALVVGELAVVVAGSRSVILGIACGVVVGAGVVRALWISSGNDWSFVSASGWIGAALGALTAFAWVAPRGRVRDPAPREDDTRLAP